MYKTVQTVSVGIDIIIKCSQCPIRGDHLAIKVTESGVSMVGGFVQLNGCWCKGVVEALGGMSWLLPSPGLFSWRFLAASG